MNCPFQIAVNFGYKDDIKKYTLVTTVIKFLMGVRSDCYILPLADEKDIIK